MKMPKAFIIADVGSNWKRSKNLNDNLALAFRHIDDASECGVDAVKFQLFTHRELYGVDGDNFYSLPRDYIAKLSGRCVERGVEFMCTAFSASGVRFVDPYVRRHKIASAEMADPYLLEAALETAKPVLLSTGGATGKEVLNVCHKLKDRKVDATILECVASYPARIADYNLSTLVSYSLLGLKVGVSDHTLGSTVALVAIGLGATVFEKHFDALKSLTLKETPDTATSINPAQLRNYVKRIRQGITALGDGRKYPRPTEVLMRNRWGRRLKVTKPIKNGQDILEYGLNFGSFRSLKDDLKAAKPGDAAHFEGKRTKIDLNPQDGLWFDDIE